MNQGRLGRSHARKRNPLEWNKESATNQDDALPMGQGPPIRNPSLCLASLSHRHGNHALRGELFLSKSRQPSCKHHQQVLPPSIITVEPVMYEEASETRKSTAALYSFNPAILLMGIKFVSFATKSSVRRPVESNWVSGRECRKGRKGFQRERNRRFRSLWATSPTMPNAQRLLKARRLEISNMFG